MKMIKATGFSFEKTANDLSLFLTDPFDLYNGLTNEAGASSQTKVCLIGLQGLQGLQGLLKGLSSSQPDGSKSLFSMTVGTTFLVKRYNGKGSCEP